VIHNPRACARPVRDRELDVGQRLQPALDFGGITLRADYMHVWSGIDREIPVQSFRTPLV
jgi:hypothetical protein